MLRINYTYFVSQENDDDFLYKKRICFVIFIERSYRENAFDKSVGNNTDNGVKPESRPFDFSMLQSPSEKRS